MMVEELKHEKEEKAKQMNDFRAGTANALLEKLEDEMKSYF